jgi:prophage DNA circulation protein
MPWYDRLQPASITTPDGVRYDFLYEDVSKTEQNKISTYTFSDKAGALVQNFGRGIVSLPLTMYFAGPDYDITALEFDEAAAQAGICVLDHPIYGIRNVVIESFTRADRLKTEANQAVYTITITETISEEIVVSIVQVSSEVNAKINSLAALNGAILSVADYSLDLPAAFSSALSRWSNALDQYKSKFNDILSKSDDLRAAFDSAILSVEQSLDTLLLTPKDLFSAISQIVKIPARAFASIKAKVQGYAELLALFIATPIANTDQDAKNQRLEAQGHTNALIGGVAAAYLYAAENSAVSGSESTVSDAVLDIVDSGIGFVTRSEAIQSAVQIIDQYFQAQEYLDNEQQTSEDSPLGARFSCSPDTTQVLVEIVKRTAGNLINLSFRLKQERIIELQNETTFINFCFEYYGSTKLNIIDFFLATNDLEENDFLILPRGFEARYYV